ncbi:hypothetical protein [Vacuolonema iberomarrocanum]|uniref:hypothetical protein n=1 Tax=Vacuolonema iberomarrocanum TaxID=3454632 RepID=UPI0019F06043|nr:hypothetical protein [filamentous cyanobacterium LEGE 07170]
MQQRRSTRKRGVILTNIGLQKLQTAKRKAEIWDNDGDRYTLEELGQRSGLAPITVAKVLNRETGVDKQSLVLCFSIFGLTLMDADFTKPSDRLLQAEDNNADLPSAIPQGWQVTGTRTQDYDVRLDTTVINSGSATALIQSKSPQADGFVTLMQTFKAEDYRGQRLQLSGYLKTEAVETWAGLWMRIDGAEGEILSFDNMQNRSITGTTEWTQYAVVLDAPIASDRIAFGFLLAGSGRVWCDRLNLEPVSLEVPTTVFPTELQLPTKPVNLDFEQ